MNSKHVASLAVALLYFVAGKVETTTPHLQPAHAVVKHHHQSNMPKKNKQSGAVYSKKSLAGFVI